MTLKFTLGFVCLAAAALAQAVDCAKPTRYQDWITCRAMTDDLQQKLIGSSTSNQASQPSVSDASTSLLDRTSGPDLIGAGFQLLGAGSRTNSESKSGSSVVSASAYALHTTFTGSKPLDPAVYARGANWRRIVFNVGFEDADEANSNEKYKVAGLKILLVNRRDVSSGFATRQISTLLHQVGSTSQALNVASQQVRNLIYAAVGNKEKPDVYPIPATVQTLNAFMREYLTDDTFLATVGKLTATELADIDTLFKSAGAVEAMIRQDAALRKFVFNIRRAPQLSIAWQGRLSDSGAAADIHRLQAIFDWGVWKAFEITLNGGYDYNNSRTLGGDTRAGRLAGEGRFELNQVSAVARGVNPWVIAFAGEHKWVHRTDDIYKVQTRLEIPIASGISLPVSFTYASSSDLIKESEVRGQVGFTIDAAKIMAALKPR